VGVKPQLDQGWFDDPPIQTRLYSDCLH